MSGGPHDGRRLSLAMIVRNEAANLPGCLASVADAIDEAVVIDTGSTDATVAVAEAAGAVLGHFAWCDDFAAARNAALERCTCPWILVLDADERLAREDLPRLRALVAQAPDRAYRLTTRNYTNNEQLGGFVPLGLGEGHARGYAGWYPSTKVRLFPNRSDVRFEGVVHELVNQALYRAGVPVADAAFPVHHYPLEQGTQRYREKQGLYLALGRRKLAAAPEDPRAHAELADQLAELGEYAEAIGHYRAAVSGDPENAVRVKDLGAVLYLTGREEEAEQALRLATRLAPELVEAWRNLGVLHAGRGDWSQAIACFRRCIRLAPDYSEDHRYLAVAFEGAGRLPEAAQAVRKALDLQPDNRAARSLYDSLLRRVGGLS